MVSLDQRNQRVADLRNASPICYSFLFQEPGAEQEPQTIADRAANAIMVNDRSSFEGVVEDLNRRKLKETADWVLDDLLLFTLLVGSKVFHCGGELCDAIVQIRRPTNSLDVAFHGAVRSLSQDAYAIEGNFSFAKLVFCHLIGRRQVDSSIAGTVYAELTSPNLLTSLEGLPRLLAYRSFDLLVQEGIEFRLDSMDEIVSAIESRSSDMSIRDWLRIVVAMRPSVLIWIVSGLLALCSIGFSGGLLFSRITDTYQPTPAQEPIPTKLPITSSQGDRESP